MVLLNPPGPLDPTTLGLFERALTGDHTLVLPGGHIDHLTTSTAFDPAGTQRNTPALVVHTSGSTGQPKAVGLSARALTASAAATERLLAGPGQWLLTLPHTHIAGAQVILRSLRAGTVPVVSPGRFTASSFAEVVATLPSSLPLYVSLVPTQLTRILDSAVATEAAQQFHTILLGGAAMSPHLLERAHDAGLNIVRTYGMSETGGGCVYNGVPFDAVTLSIEPDSRIRIAGPVMADGYVTVTQAGGQAQPHGQVRVQAVAHTTSAMVDTSAPAGFYGQTFLTSDLGVLDGGVLSVLGRADDVFISGGINVSPLYVENIALRALEGLGVRECVLSSVPDEEFGERATLLVAGEGLPSPEAAPSTADPLTTRVKEALRGSGLSAAETPHRVFAVDQIPLKGIGKPDRLEARRIAMQLTGALTDT